MSTEQRELRAAQNQLLFRSVNEQILTLGDTLRLGESLMQHAVPELDFVCECDKQGCNDPITMSVDEFAAIEHAAQNRFVVRRGHEDVDVEDVVADRARYLVVAKRGAGADLVARRR